MPASAQEIILQQGQRESLHDMPLHVVWHLTYMCNYQCSYCTQNTHRPKTRDFLPWEQMERAVRHLAASNRPSHLIGLSGGEPTIHPNFYDLCVLLDKTFGKKLSCVYIVSNGSRQADLYDKLAELARRMRLNLTISIHTDHADLAHIEYLVQRLSSQMWLNFNLMFNPEKRKFVHEIYETLCRLRKSHPFHLDIMTLRECGNGGGVDRRYTEHDFVWQHSSQAEFTSIAQQSSISTTWKNNFPVTKEWKVLKDGEYLTAGQVDTNSALQTGKYIFTNKYCTSGTHLLSVEPDGKTSGTICGQRVWAAQPLHVANPYDDPAFMRLQQCTQATCGCRANDYLMKFSCKAEAEGFLHICRAKQQRLQEEYRHNNILEQTLLAQTKLLQRYAQGLPATLEDAVDSDYYMHCNPDVAASGMSAAYHYQNHGWQEGRNPNEWFDTKAYLERYPDVREGGINPLHHYLHNGIIDGKKTILS